MDFQSLTAAHRQPQNQLRFDAEAFDRAVLRAERRRAVLRRVWAAVTATASALVARRRGRVFVTPPAASGVEGR